MHNVPLPAVRHNRGCADRRGKNKIFLAKAIDIILKLEYNKDRLKERTPHIGARVQKHEKNNF